MTIETEHDIDGLKRVGRVVAVVLREMLDCIEAGMTTAELDDIGRALLNRHGARSAPQVTYNFPGATCISVNEEAAHGIPGPRVIRPGDVVNIDVSAELDAYFADTGGTRVVPPSTPTKDRLCRTTKLALREAILEARAGNKINRIGKAAQRVAKAHQFKIIKNLAVALTITDIAYFKVDTKGKNVLNKFQAPTRQADANGVYKQNILVGNLFFDVSF